MTQLHPLLNLNIGVLGHVDSGKTSLAKALSTVSSTAAFDKNPQSKERGITLDLGFSSFSIQDHKFKDSYESLQFTLVDCPGHASLIRTIIGGAQILDLMMLVIDIQKGIQTQTAECLVIGEITCDTLIVVLNKIDTIPESKRDAAIERMSKRLRLTLQNTKFKDAPIIPVSAFPGENEAPLGLSNLIHTLNKVSFIPKRDPRGPFLFAVDHCFSIRGQGTIMTGTVLQGSIRINDNVEISSIKETRKVKGIQMFKRPVEEAVMGDRVGICVTQFDAKLLERGIVSTPNTVPVVHALIINLNKIAYYKGEICTKSKFHICVGHETVLARITVFGNEGESFSLEDEFVFMEKYLSQSSKDEASSEAIPSKQYILLEFEHPISIAPGSRVLGTKLDTDINANTCRLAFHGEILRSYYDKNYASQELPLLRVYKNKSKEGVVDRMNNDYLVICRGMFKKETNIQSFAGLKVRLSTGERGQIEGGFGQSGKFKVALDDVLSDPAREMLDQKKKKTAGGSVTVHLDFKRYVFDSQKKMVQS